MTALCIECGDELIAERAELGYRYCTKKDCQNKHHKGVTVTAIGVNKSADTLIVGDPEEIRKRGEAGEFARKDNGLGLDYRGPGAPSAGAGGAATPEQRRAAEERRALEQRRAAKQRQAAEQRRAAARRRAPARPGWTAEQEKIVRLYHGMGLTPREIVERARANTPRLGITESLVTRIMCSPPRRLSGDRDVR